ncbi:MAG: flippase-like domain-containing protein [Pirellulales bacterium]|nr:flippase-like domain-containing protein [Pirellulales bacterium]
MSGSRRRRIVRLARWLIAALVVLGLGVAARSAIHGWQTETQKLEEQLEKLGQRLEQADSKQRGELLEEQRRIRQNVPSVGNLRWRWLGLAALLYGAGLIPPALVLHRALLGLGEHPRLSTTIAAQLLGHAGKYVPGKAMVIVLRSGALSQDNVRVLASTVSVFMETFLMMAVGAAIAGVVICWLPVPTWMIVMAILVAIGASLPTFPPVLKLVAARVAKSEPTVGSMRTTRLFLAGWLYSFCSWVLIGASFTALIYAIPSASALPSLGQLYAIATAAIALAVVAGFASLLPGGAGVRELVLTTILGVALGTTHGLLAAIAARLMFIMVEGLMGALAWCWLRRSASTPDPGMVQ